MELRLESCARIIYKEDADTICRALMPELPRLFHALPRAA